MWVKTRKKERKEKDSAKSCLTLATLWTVACQPPLSLGISQARILEWVAISFSRGSSWPRNWTQVSSIAGGFLTDWATREARKGRCQMYRRHSLKGLLGGVSGKEPACRCRRHKRQRLHPWVGKIPWRRTWPLTPVFLPGESHGQRSLEGCSPWGCEESDRT